MKTLLIACFLFAGCFKCASCKLHVGDIVETRLDHRAGQIIAYSPCGFYTVRLNATHVATFFEFELELKQNRIDLERQNSQN